MRAYNLNWHLQENIKNLNPNSQLTVSSSQNVKNQVSSTNQGNQSIINIKTIFYC